MDAAAIRAFARRDRRAAQKLKRTYWAERFRSEGFAATLGAAQALWQYARRARPDWPAEKDRRDDWQHHLELKRRIDCAADAFTAR